MRWAGWIAAAGLVGAAASAASLAQPSPQSSPQSSPQAAPRPGPEIGGFGFDLAGMDPSLRPGDDFFRYSGGTWLRTTTIAADKIRYGTFDALADRAEADVRAIVEGLLGRAHPPGSIEQKIADFYSAYTDVAAIEKRGLALAEPGLGAIAKASTHADVAALIARPDLPVAGPIGWAIWLDAKDPDRYLVTIMHGGLGLPEREFYLRDDAQFAEVRDKYRAHVARLLALGGQPDPERAAGRIVSLEREIATRHWPVAKRRERELTYNLRTRSQLEALAPDYPWAAAFQSAGLDGVGEFMVRELDAIAALGALFKATPVDTWRSYLAYHYLRNVASVLPRAFDDEVFSFYGKALNGQHEKRPRWKRALTALDGALGEAVGQLYVRRHFPPEAKAIVRDMVENMRAAYGERIDALPWMTPETKKLAREKLAAFRAKIGYPDRWRDYGGLEIRPGDAFGNASRSRLFDDAFERARLGRKSDRDEWAMPPQVSNAYYVREFNEIAFTAAILKPPYFDPAADPAVNYGAIGGVIGHEMGHAFDDQGAKSDARGVLRTWWNPRDEAAFKALGDRLVEQYGQFEPLPGLRLNGRLTLGENIGDLGGLSVAYEAYRRSLRGVEPPRLGGLTGDQRFFHSWAQAWRTLERDQFRRNQVMTGPHSPGEFRVNGVVRNIDAWYRAFDVQAGDRLYLPPEQRVHIW
jgi:putative endopeptidase